MSGIRLISEDITLLDEVSVEFGFVALERGGWTLS
jgi:hypothetical protein